MRLAVDASVLIAEALRVRGRRLITHPDLDLVVAAEAWGETEHELPKRVTRMLARGLVTNAQAQAILENAMYVSTASTTLAPPSAYVHKVNEAAQRIPRDAADIPTMALALALGCGIWTNDRDFFGCGVAVWGTDVLLRHLETTGQE